MSSTWPSLKTSLTTFRLEVMQLQGFGKVCLMLPCFRGELSTRGLLFVLPLSSQMDCCCVERNKMQTFMAQIPLGVTYATLTSFFPPGASREEKLIFTTPNSSQCDIYSFIPAALKCFGDNTSVAVNLKSWDK